MKEKIKKILLDMIPVILGILIALFIGNIKENIDDKSFVKKILSSASQDRLCENKILDSVIPAEAGIQSIFQVFLATRFLR